VKLVAPPDGHRHLRDERQQPARLLGVVAQAARAVDRFGDVRDHAAAPAAELVAEDPEAPGEAAADGALRDDAALGPVTLAQRRGLDHEPPFGQANLERRVVELARRPAADSGRERLVDLPVEPHRVTARAEREPVEVDRSAHRVPYHRARRALMHRG